MLIPAGTGFVRISHRHSVVLGMRLCVMSHAWSLGAHVSTHGVLTIDVDAVDGDIGAWAWGLQDLENCQKFQSYSYLKAVNTYVLFMSMGASSTLVVCYWGHEMIRVDSSRGRAGRGHEARS